MAKSTVPVKRTSQVPQPYTVNNMLNDFFGDSWFPSNMLSYMSSLESSFKMDLEEDDKEYTVKAEMPGVKKADISLDLKDGVLTISAESKENVGDGKKKTRKERNYTYMEREIYLPYAADAGAKAQLKDGELVVTVPKAPETTKQSKIEVS